MDSKSIIIGVLAIIGLAAGGFGFFQTQNLTDLQDSSTQVASDLRGAGTQLAEEAAATGTQSADNAIATGTQQADNAIANSTSFADLSFGTATEVANNVIATSTQQGDNVFATQTELADQAASTGTALVNSANESSTEQADNANATQTELADNANATQNELANIANATGTQQADNANSTATQSADNAATEAAFGTDTANNLATQQLELTVAAIVFNDSQATSDAANIELSGTLEAIGIGGNGIQGTSATLPDTFDLFEGEGYEIALPDGFVGGDFAGNDVDDLEDELNDADLDAIFDNLSSQDDNFLFFAIDSTLFNGVPQTTISLIREEALRQGFGLEQYISSAIFSLQGDFALISSDIILMNGQQTGRIIIDQQLSNTAVRQVQYIFSVDNEFYILTITTPISEYANIRENLETIAASLRIR